MYGLMSLRSCAWISTSRPGWIPAASSTLYTVVSASSGELLVWLKWHSANFLQPSWMRSRISAAQALLSRWPRSLAMRCFK